MPDWINQAIYWIATFTDAYFKSDLPAETWDAFCDMCIKAVDLVADYLIFIVDFIQRVTG